MFLSIGQNSMLSRISREAKALAQGKFMAKILLIIWFFVFPGHNPKTFKVKCGYYISSYRQVPCQFGRPRPNRTKQVGEENI